MNLATQNPMSKWSTYSGGTTIRDDALPWAPYIVTLPATFSKLLNVTKWNKNDIRQYSGPWTFTTGCSYPIYWIVLLWFAPCAACACIFGCIASQSDKLPSPRQPSAIWDQNLQIGGDGPRYRGQTLGRKKKDRNNMEKSYLHAIVSTRCLEYTMSVEFIQLRI